MFAIGIDSSLSQNDALVQMSPVFRTCVLSSAPRKLSRYAKIVSTLETQNYLYSEYTAIYTSPPSSRQRLPSGARYRILHQQQTMSALPSRRLHVSHFQSHKTSRRILPAILAVLSNRSYWINFVESVSLPT